MASEYPRRHVWSADPNDSLTWLIEVGPESGIGSRYFLIKSPTPVAAIAVSVGEVLPISDDWKDIVIICRPLKEHETSKVNVKDGEVIELDEESHFHLISNPTNGEDHGEEKEETEG